MKTERVLITVKTYPTLSRKYGETVCTAGIRQDGSWVRIYPVPFRRLTEREQYKKFDWLECELKKSRRDHRPETYHPTDLSKLRVVGHIETKQNWRERRVLLTARAKVYTKLRTIIDGAKSNKMSLAVFKPTVVKNFKVEDEEKDWDIRKVQEMKNRTDQGALFTDESWRETFKLIPKLPFSFSYEFEDDEGKVSKMQILDWEIGALYWNCLKTTDGDEQAALLKVRKKYVDEFGKTDLHFFLGTTQEFHSRAPNPWVIVGVCPLPHERQMELPDSGT